MSTDKITLSFSPELACYAIPSAHFLAQAKGYYAAEGIKVALLEPNDPSDVTEIIGSGKVDMGCKAMIHTIAGKARGFPIKSIGTLLDEPFTGVIYLEGSGVTEDFTSLRGKRIGYVGEFGKIQIDELTTHYGLTPNDYTAVRCGMNIARAIKEGTIDAGIGLENVQMCEVCTPLLSDLRPEMVKAVSSQLEEWCKTQGRPTSDVKMLRIDELAELGCCCFCSILYIASLLGRGGALGGLRLRPLELDHVHTCERSVLSRAMRAEIWLTFSRSDGTGNEDFLNTHKSEAAAFMRAVKRATDEMFADPKAAWDAFCESVPFLQSKSRSGLIDRNVRSFTYMSRDAANVVRDWTKVTNYSKRLGIVSDDFNPNMTNEFLSWPLLDEVADPIENQKRIARRQMQIAMKAEGCWLVATRDTVPHNHVDGLPIKSCCL
ncbi:NMT1/THI5 like [Rhizoctonia solani]|uniref:4-amino-5-hydroxymethyl-2-methylpyrimidine phosphate synthase n=1 Tax=Rhizoctonia solani TaxID=456999 RepID=A0A8H7IFK1_9AGAM|nr:NMT1/THI5 like [Rhizoctonia solani]